MTYFITSVNIVLPLFLLIGLGYLLRRRGILCENTCVRMNTLSFDVLIPCMVFYNIYTADLSVITSPAILLFAFVTTAAVFLFLLGLTPRLVRDPAKIGVVIQGCFRGSFVILGMGLAASLYPGRNLGVVAITSTVVAPLYNICAVIALELFSREKAGPRGMMKSIVLNPLIIASALAIPFLLLGVRLPTALDSAVKSLSGCATAISLITLGGSLNFSGIREDRLILVFTCAVKLLILPLIFVPVAAAMGFRDMELLTVLILFGSPAAVSFHVMSVQAGADGRLAGQIVVLTTCFSAFTLFGFIYVLLSLGYL